MRNKIIKISAAVIAAVLLFGGLFLLFHDDVGEMIQEEKNQAVCAGFYYSGTAGKY